MWFSLTLQLSINIALDCVFMYRSNSAFLFSVVYQDSTDFCKYVQNCLLYWMVMLVGILVIDAVLFLMMIVTEVDNDSIIYGDDDWDDVVCSFV